MASSRAAIEIVLTERYRFLPQTLDEGSAAACAPLLAALADDSVPWAQSLAFYDLCLLCEVKNGDGNDGIRDLLFDDEGRGATYAPAAAAALAPVLSVASATRAALDAAERDEQREGRRLRGPEAAARCGVDVEVDDDAEQGEERAAHCTGA